MSNLRVLNNNIFFQYVNFIQLIISGIVLVPFYFKYFTVETYGIWLGVSSALSYLIILDPGFSMYILNEVPKLLRVSNSKRLHSLIFSALFANVIITIVLCFLFIIIFQFDTLKMMWNKEVFDGFTYLFVSVIISFYSSVFIALNTTYGKTFFVGFVNALSGFGGILLTVYLLTKDFGIKSIGITMFYRSAFVLVMNFMYSLKNISIGELAQSFGWDTLKFDLKQNYYLFKGKMGNVLSTEILYPLLTAISPISSVKFKMSRTLGDLSKFIIDRPFYALMPIIASKHVDADRTAIITFMYKLMKLLIVVLAILFFQLVYSNKVFIKYWVGSESYIGDINNLFLSVYIVALIINQIFTYLLYALGDSIKTNRVIFFQGIITVLLLLVTYLLSPIVFAFLLVLVFIEIAVLFLFLYRVLYVLNLEVFFLRRTLFFLIKVLVLGLIASSIAVTVENYIYVHDLFSHFSLLFSYVVLLYTFGFLRFEKIRDLIKELKQFTTS